MTNSVPIRFLFLLLTLCSSGIAQICDNRSGGPMQMQVQLTFGDASTGATPGDVSTENDPLHRGEAAGVQRSHDFATTMQIHVQLQDATAGTLQEMAPSSDGQVRMTVCKNFIYRLRVTGPGIEEAIVDSVQPGRGDKMVTVVLHRKLTKEERKARTSTVSAQQLRVPKKARKQVEKGDAALRKGNLAEAENRYRKAIILYPQFEEAQNSLGVTLMRDGKKAEGRAAFEAAIAVNRNYAPAQVNLAKIAFDEKRFADAYGLAQQALRTEPLNASALFVAAEAAFFKGEYDDTVSYARTLHSLPHQQYALAHYLAAKSLEAQHQPDAAIGEYETFLQEDPTDPNAKRARELIMLLQASTAPTRAQTAPRQ